jgi:hypothetical protein
MATKSKSSGAKKKAAKSKAPKAKKNLKRGLSVKGSSAVVSIGKIGRWD